MNQKMLEYLREHADKYPEHLEQNFPHVFEKLLEFWGTARMRPYFDELIMSNRPNRLGFPAEAVTEIWTLSRVYAELHPDASTESEVTVVEDVWNVDIEVGRGFWKH
jgi:hypothetical protein